MPFPDYPRYRYQKHTLQNVICQLRFPTILRIGSEPPSDFQDKVREQFPLYWEIRQTLTEIELPEPLARLVREQMSLSSGPVAHQFRSADKRWLVSLANGALSLTDSAYTRWEEFRDHLEGPLLGLEGIYHPAFYDRIGLRYQNLIRRSELGLSGVEWRELLQPHIAGEFSQPEVASEIEQAARQVVIDLAADQGKVQIQHGLVRPAAVANSEIEVCFGIDADFYRQERSEVQDARKVLDSLNKRARSVFRWCITERLHAAMEPKSL